MIRESFVIYKNWADSINALPEEYQLEAYKSLIDYGVTGEIPKGVSQIVNAILISFSVNMKNCISRYKASVENGKKGGNPNFIKGQPNPYYKNNLNKKDVLIVENVEKLDEICNTEEQTQLSKLPKDNLGNLKDNLETSQDNFTNNSSSYHNLNENEDVNVNDNVDDLSKKQGEEKEDERFKSILETSTTIDKLNKLYNFEFDATTKIPKNIDLELLSQKIGESGYLKSFRSLNDLILKYNDIISDKYKDFVYKKGSGKEAKVHKYSKEKLNSLFDDIENIEI